MHRFRLLLAIFAMTALSLAAWGAMNPALRKVAWYGPVRWLHGARKGSDGAYYMKKGAYVYVADQYGNPTLSGFDEFRRLSNGARVGLNGPLQFLVDNEGKRMSCGFDSFTPLKHGEYRARLGSAVFRLNSNGAIVWTRDHSGDSAVLTCPP
ncbi:MAG TPA: hypothetical protein VHF05_00310 [Candidatus Paceibacterota bacterium]|nr:hypothetical protein [Candidatus Paceibacterota bacterium]